ncbi:MAG: Rrf2 family transcriptional regulator [Candidatus Omnitrophota bacterium]|nr:Rrf2 family transcriptional regulator [Candidatus Omnitrophota bacterium]
MKISARTDYACRALLELSLHWPSPTPLQINAIAEKQKIPIKFLTQILIGLKQLGLVESVRGKKGGYMLSKPPQDIRLSEVVKSFTQSGVRNQARGQKQPQTDVFNAIWKEIDEATWKIMDNVNFGDIVKRDRSLNKVPMFDI